MIHKLPIPIIFLIAALLCQTTSTTTSRTFTVGDYWATPGTLGGESAVYLEIINSTQQPDTLVSASSPVAEAVELRETVEQEGQIITQPVSGGIEIEGVDIVNLEPGGDHILLIGLKEELQSGDSIEVTLQLETGKTFTVSVPVQDQ